MGGWGQERGTMTTTHPPPKPPPPLHCEQLLSGWIQVLSINAMQRGTPWRAPLLHCGHFSFFCSYVCHSTKEYISLYKKYMNLRHQQVWRLGEILLPILVDHSCNNFTSHLVGVWICWALASTAKDHVQCIFCFIFQILCFQRIHSSHSHVIFHFMFWFILIMLLPTCEMNWNWRHMSQKMA